MSDDEDKSASRRPKRFDKRAVRPKTAQGVSADKNQKNVIGRDKTVRVKTARGRRLSSTRWLQRQLNDPYVAAAKEYGYRSRAAFKIIEIDDKFKIFKKGQTVIDLGAAPGGWSQIGADRIESIEGRGKIVALDIQEMEPLPGVDVFLGDFSEEAVPQILIDAAGHKVDVVMSDMAPFTTGVQSADHIRILNLVEAAIFFSDKVLKRGGTFVSKLFEGGGGETLSAMLRERFETVKYFKPSSSRSDSSEVFLVALNYKGLTPKD